MFISAFIVSNLNQALFLADSVAANQIDPTDISSKALVPTQPVPLMQIPMILGKLIVQILVATRMHLRCGKDIAV